MADVFDILEILQLHPSYLDCRGLEDMGAVPPRILGSVPYMILSLSCALHYSYSNQKLLAGRFVPVGMEGYLAEKKAQHCKVTAGVADCGGAAAAHSRACQTRQPGLAAQPPKERESGCLGHTRGIYYTP